MIPTGAANLDKAIGIGGVPRGRVTIVYGHESSGKTTLATHIIANAQKLGLKAVLIDVEHAFDITYAKKIGVKIEDLIFLQPDSGEQAFKMLELLLETGEIGVAVIDSVAHLVPENELETGKSEMGGIARLMSAGLRRVAAPLRRNNTALVLINQIRMKIGVMFGNPETQPGGKAARFSASVEIKIAKNGIIGDKEKPSGIKTRAKITKNKIAPPGREAEFDIIYGIGIDKYGCFLDLAAETGVITKKSSYFTINGVVYAGREKAIDALKADEALFDEIYKKVMAADTAAPTDTAEPTPGEAESVEFDDDEDDENGDDES